MSLLKNSILATALLLSFPALADQYHYRVSAKGVLQGHTASAFRMLADGAGSLPAAEQLFPDTLIGSGTQAISLQLENTGSKTASLQLPAFGGANPGDFQASSDCEAIPSGETCSVDVAFQPTDEGVRSATIRLSKTQYSFYGTGLKVPVVWDKATRGGTINLSPQNNSSIGGGRLRNYGSILATAGKSSGKWYWEVKGLGGSQNGVGIATSAFPSGTQLASTTVALPPSSTYFAVSTTPDTVYYGTPPTTTVANGEALAVGQSWVPNVYGSSYGFALDLDAKILTVYFYSAGACSSAPIVQWRNVGAGPWYPMLSMTTMASNDVSILGNFAASSFTCAPPAGFKPL